MKENGIFMIIILLSITSNCEAINLKLKKNFQAQILISATSKSINNSSNSSSNSSMVSNTSNSKNPIIPPPGSNSSTIKVSNASMSSATVNSSVSTTNITNSNTTNSTKILSTNDSQQISTDNTAAICNEAKDYQLLILEVEISIRDLENSFTDHLKLLGNFSNSSVDLEDQLLWKSRARDMIDYYINKTAALLDVYTDLNKTINEISQIYCNPKKNETASNSNPPSPLAPTEPLAPIKNQTKIPNETQSVVIPANKTELQTNNESDVIPPNRKIVVPSSLQAKKMSIKEMRAYTGGLPSYQHEPTTFSSKNSHHDIISIFIQKMQDAASQSGLPNNYVQTKLKEIHETKLIAIKMRHSQRLKRRTISTLTN